MRFQIEKKELIQHIQYLASIIPNKITSPILNNYLLEAVSDTNIVRITASDLELTVVAEFDANVMEGGITTISARSFNEIVQSMPDALLSVYKQDEIIKIQCNKIDFSLLCADHTLFPVIPDRDTHNAIKIDALHFQRMVNKTSFAVSTDVNRAVLNGVCWLIKPDWQMMSATDGRKVAEIKYFQCIPIDNNSSSLSTEEVTEDAEQEIPISVPEVINFSETDSNNGIEKILPSKTLTFLQKIFGTAEKELLVVIKANRVMFVYGEYTIFTHVIEHKYPDYQKAFISDLPNNLLINKDVLRTGIRRVALLAPEDNLRIRFELSEARFEINTSNRDAGEAKEIVENYAFTGSATTIAFNYKYMLSILDSIDTDNVKICLGTQKDPIMIYNETQPEQQEITFLLMPLRS